MSRPKPLVRLAIAAALVLGMLAGIQLTASSQVALPRAFTQDVNECYFASVSNGEDFGLGASSTSLTVQNLSDEPTIVFLQVGGPNGFTNGGFATLEAFGSRTFSPSSMGIAAGTTAPVVASAYDAANAARGNFANASHTPINCVAKQAVAGNNLPATSSTDTSVAGYNGVSGVEIGVFDNTYLPIVQTNCGPGGCWDTVVRVANVSDFATSMTVNFFPADDASASLGQGFQLVQSVAAGAVWSITLSDHVADGWVGSAEIAGGDREVVAIADRFKVGTNMWITNSAAGPIAVGDVDIPGTPNDAPYVLYVPDARLDFSRWNTGISVTNIANTENEVTVRYLGQDGAAPTAQTTTIAPDSMSYFYNPSTANQECQPPVNGVATCDFVGAAVIVAQAPIAAAIDGVKYVGSGDDVGHAFSYVAAGNAHTFQSAALVQRGRADTGMGATSGLSFINPNAAATNVTAHWIDMNGEKRGDATVKLLAFSSGYIYTMQQSILPNNWMGSALVYSDLPVAGTTGNVDYQVSGDGAAYWNLTNPCGQYAAVGACDVSIAPPLLPGTPIPGTLTFFFCGSVTGTAPNQECVEPIEGLDITITGGSIIYETTDVDGMVITEVLPPDLYEVCWSGDDQLGIPVIDGCENVEVNGNTVHYIDVALNAWLDICVEDAGLHVGIPGANITVFSGTTSLGQVRTNGYGYATLMIPRAATDVKLNVTAENYTTVTGRTVTTIDPIKGGCESVEPTPPATDPTFGIGDADVLVSMTYSGAGERVDGFLVTLVNNDRPLTAQRTVWLYAVTAAGVCPNLTDEDAEIEPLSRVNSSRTGGATLTIDPDVSERGDKYCIAVSSSVITGTDPDLTADMAGPFLLPTVSTGLFPVTIDLADL